MLPMLTSIGIRLVCLSLNFSLKQRGLAWVGRSSEDPKALQSLGFNTLHSKRSDAYLFILASRIR